MKLLCPKIHPSCHQQKSLLFLRKCSENIDSLATFMGNKVVIRGKVILVKDVEDVKQPLV